jgi:hypothetical protein
MEERQNREENVAVREKVSEASTAHFEGSVDTIVRDFDTLAKTGCTRRVKH